MVVSKIGFCSGVLVFSEDLSCIVIIESKKKGNYGFPKGKREKGELDWTTTALRELKEEANIDKSQIAFLCAVPPRGARGEPFSLDPSEPHLAFVEESFLIGPDKMIFCRYAIARVLSYSMPRGSKNISLQPMDSTEILSVDWIAIEQATLDKLHPKRSALLFKAKQLIEIFHQNFLSL